VATTTEGDDLSDDRIKCKCGADWAVAATEGNPMRLALALLGTLACLAHWCGPARAGTTERAIAVLCPGREDLAPLFEASARRHMVHPVELVAKGSVESGCDPTAVNPRTHAIGVMQILQAGSANPRHLSEAALFDPATNINLGAAHLARCLVLCGAFGGAVAVYHGSARCSHWRHDRHVARVLARLARVWRALEVRR
jgi:hypothetical protein